MLTTREDLCALLLRQQGLLGGRALGAAGGAVAWVRQQGFLALETRVRGLVASHDLVLFNRLSNYQAGNLDMALYGGGPLFEHYLHVLGALPAGDYALSHDPERAARAAEPGSMGATVLACLESEGASTLRDLQNHLRSVGWRQQRCIGKAVRDLYTSGAILVHQREGDQPAYDLAGRVLPRARHTCLPVAERLQALASRTLHILAPVTRATWGQILNAVGSRSRLDLAAMKREKSRLIAEMLARGEAVQVEVENPPQWYILPAGWLPLLGQKAHAGAPRVSFLSPLDPVVWDGQRARDLFGFDGRQQAHPVPPQWQRLGASALPILYGQALVGRLEPQMRWSRQQLNIHAIHLDNPSLAEDPHFRAAFAAALEDLATLHEARDIQATALLPPRLLP